ncbi:hypothetical protein FHS07_000064 [Microbacterium proteolyticum]|uniref:Uncharacterized protein n=1 Tax=Microbacterium proteolyticum TaxID=1572644 RepID=A0A7W5CES7_9MICO|nr:hypothetical protein [Microbacterium proteolyticum]MBB3156380.1 hypothetical protein [Microbacterium proteolyticum]
MTDQNPHDGDTPADRERLATPVDETPAHDHPVSSVRAGEHRSVPASAHANSGARDHDTLPRTADAPQYGVGPFSVREVALLGIWVVAFFVSFFRINILDSPSGVLIGGLNVWLSGLWWIPTVALPTIAVGLLVLRRLSPQGIRRVGSLGIDQFASVAFTVSAFVWVSWVWDTVVIFNETGIWTRSWVIWVEAVVLLAGVVLTVFGPVIPPFAQDFRGREEVPAHRSSRPIRPVVSRPRAPRAPRTPQHGGDDHASAHPGEDHTLRHGVDEAAPGSYTGSTDVAHDEAAPRTTVLSAHVGDDSDTDVFAPLRADRDQQANDAHLHDAYRSDDARHDDRRLDDQPLDDGRPDDRHDDDDDRHGEYGRSGYLRDGQRRADEPHRAGDHDSQNSRDDHPHAQAFWALAPEQREIVDDYGTPIFHIGPTAWALVVEDRGETFVVRHDDGRIGYLHDVSGITRG